MSEVRASARTGGGCLLFIVAIGLVVYGAQVFRAASFRIAPRELSCGEYLSERPADRWVSLTGCVLDVGQAVALEQPDGTLSGLYVPVRPNGGLGAVAILLDTQDPELIARYRTIASMDQVDDLAQALSQTPELFVSAVPLVQGLVRSGASMGGEQRTALRRVGADLASDVIVLRDGARPPLLAAGTAAALGVALLALLGWWSRGRWASLGSGKSVAAVDGASGVIRIESLTKEFTKGSQTLRVLRGIDLTLFPGERVAIQGESGSGKSTFLQVLGTLDRPTRGRIWFGDVDVFARPPTELDALRNRTIGFVFQFHHLLPDQDALHNVMIPAQIAGVPAAQAAARARDLLVRVGLGDRLSHRPGELSGGEQQRVAIARALVRRPTLILADEPTGNLDPSLASGVLDLLMQLNEEVGSTLIVVTHSNELASRFNRRLVLVDGQFVELGHGEGEA